MLVILVSHDAIPCQAPAHKKPFWSISLFTRREVYAAIIREFLQRE